MRSPARHIAILAAITLFGFSLARAADDNEDPTKPSEEEVRKADRLVQLKIAELKGRDMFYKYVDDPLLRRLLPGRMFFGVHLIQYPVAKALPKSSSLKVHNIFVVEKDGTLRHLTEGKGLEKYFQETLVPSKEPAAQKDMARVWLRLVQEFAQDGYFGFVLMDDATQVEAEKAGTSVTGKVVVSDGGEGDISATLKFDKEGKLKQASAVANLRTGDRPRCQATKLLDPDSAVRELAEQSILRMGVAANGYLADQRAKADGDLQKAIDHIGERVAAREKAGPPICRPDKLLDLDPIVRYLAERAILALGPSAREYLQAERSKAGPELREAIDRLKEKTVITMSAPGPSLE